MGSRNQSFLIITSELFPTESFKQIGGQEYINTTNYIVEICQKQVRAKHFLHLKVYLTICLSYMWVYPFYKIF